VWRLRVVEAPRGSREGVGSVYRRRKGAEGGAWWWRSNGGVGRAQGDDERRARAGSGPGIL
jgi:hypothetical protein